MSSTGSLICYATKCTEGLSVGEFLGGLGLAVLFVIVLVWTIKCLQGGDDD